MRAHSDECRRTDGCRRGRAGCGPRRALVEPAHDRVVDVAADVRGRHSSGGGTCGSFGHGRRPGSPANRGRRWTVRISVSATWPMARAWVVDLPTTGTVTSMSMTDGGPGVGQVLGGGPHHGPAGGRLHRRDGGAQPAAPEQEPVPVQSPGTTGRNQRFGLWVGSSPSHLRASMRRGIYGATPLSRSASMPDTPWPGDACSLVDAFRSGSARRSRSSRPRWPPSRPATSTPSPSSTPTALGPGRRPPTCRSPSAACRSG